MQNLRKFYPIMICQFWKYLTLPVSHLLNPYHFQDVFHVCISSQLIYQLLYRDRRAAFGEYAADPILWAVCCHLLDSDCDLQFYTVLSLLLFYFFSSPHFPMRHRSDHAFLKSASWNITIFLCFYAICYLRQWGTVLSHPVAECLAFELAKKIDRARQRSRWYRKASNRTRFSELPASPLPILEASSTSSVYKIRLSEHTPFFTEKIVCSRSHH